MKKLILTSLMLLGLAACAPQTTVLYYKQGMVLASKQKDYDACKIKSLKEIPQNTVTSYNPGVNNPGTLSCYTIGYSTQCNRVGALYIPPSTSSYDENEGLRDRFIDECMNAKGYKLVELQNCKDGEKGYYSMDKAPALSKVQCYDYNSPSIDD